MPANPSEPPSITGSTYHPTPAGFAEFLAEASQMDAAGYEVVTLVRLTRHLAAVFRRRAPKNPKPGGSFYED